MITRVLGLYKDHCASLNPNLLYFISNIGNRSCDYLFISPRGMVRHRNLCIRGISDSIHDLPDAS